MLQHVPHERIRQVWPWVREGVAAAIKKTGSRYLPEDVYADLINKAAGLYLIGGRGFVIFQTRKDLDGSNLHVFLLWCPGGMGNKADILAAIDKLARDMGAVRVTAQGRKGWARLGFVEVSRNFERVVYG